MPRPKSNLKVHKFAERLDWIVDNLDTDPSLLRFCTCRRDIFDALVNSVEQGIFVSGAQYRDGERRGIPTSKTWERAIMSDSVPPVLMDWVLTLFPDLSGSWLTVGTLQDFHRTGKRIQLARDRWRRSIELFVNDRRRLENVARAYYKDVDASQNGLCPLKDIRLLTQRGWIRKRPMLLEENTERSILRSPERGRTFPHLKLAGLTGSYISYKGSLTYRKRRASKIEPQHNGEIFCVSSIVYSEGDFVGFHYNLAHYYDYVNTCEILGAELADWIIESENLTGRPPALPYRGKPEHAFDFDTRACYPGVNCLTVFKNYSESRIPTGNYFLLHKRDETQLQAQNCVHVLPAGGHQGYSKGSQLEDTAIWRTVVREFFEELFDKEQLYRQPESWEDFLAYPDVRRLADVFFLGANPAAAVYLHGFGLDPITLKPEVLLTIVVDWAKVLTQTTGLRLTFNWEVKNRALSRHAWAKLSKSELIRQANGLVQSIGDSYRHTLPAASACMIATAENYDLLFTT